MPKITKMNLYLYNFRNEDNNNAFLSGFWMRQIQRTDYRERRKLFDSGRRRWSSSMRWSTPLFERPCLRMNATTKRIASTVFIAASGKSISSPWSSSKSNSECTLVELNEQAMISGGKTKLFMWSKFERRPESNLFLLKTKLHCRKDTDYCKHMGIRNLFQR